MQLKRLVVYRRVRRRLNGRGIEVKDNIVYLRIANNEVHVSKALQPCELNCGDYFLAIMLLLED